MAFGLDYVTGPPVEAMKAHTPPVEFVCRYTGYFSGYDITRVHVPQGKVLTPGEAESHSKAGIALVSNWEWYANRALEGHDAGIWDAGKALQIHTACGGPADRPIYFSVDIDVAGEQVAGYFHGIASALGLPRTGAYGSFRVLHYLFNAGLISWGWQTYGWSYGAWEPRAHIQQYQNRMDMAGHEVDYNRSMKDDYGQWQYTAGGEELLMRIDISNPLVAHHFTQMSDNEWRCILNGVSLKGFLLKFYRGFGNSALCGLTWFGLPVSPEIPYPGSEHGAVLQHFENGVLALDVAHEFDHRPGDNGPVYLAKLYSGAGQDPRIAQLQTQITQYQGQITSLEQKISTSPTVSMQAVDPTLTAQITTLQGQLSSALSRLAQINQLSGVGT